MLGFAMINYNVLMLFCGFYAAKEFLSDIKVFTVQGKTSFLVFLLLSYIYFLIVEPIYHSQFF